MLCYIGLCNAKPKHWKVFRRDNENDLVVSNESVQPFKNLPPTFRQACAFYVSKSFQKLKSEVRLVEAGFTDQTIAALYVLPFKLNNNNTTTATITTTTSLFTNITPPANSKANRGRWCVDGLRFITNS